MNRRHSGPAFSEESQAISNPTLSASFESAVTFVRRMNAFCPPRWDENLGSTERRPKAAAEKGRAQRECEAPGHTPANPTLSASFLSGAERKLPAEALAKAGQMPEAGKLQTFSSS